MNEDRMAAPKNATPGQFTMQVVTRDKDYGHAYIWCGDQWQCTARLDLAPKILAMLQREKQGD